MGSMIYTITSYRSGCGNVFCVVVMMEEVSILNVFCKCSCCIFLSQLAFCTQFLIYADYKLTALLYNLPLKKDIAMWLGYRMQRPFPFSLLKISFLSTCWLPQALSGKERKLLTGRGILSSPVGAGSLLQTQGTLSTRHGNSAPSSGNLDRKSVALLRRKTVRNYNFYTAVMSLEGNLALKNAHLTFRFLLSESGSYSFSSD